MVVSDEITIREWDKCGPEDDPLLRERELEPNSRSLAAELTKSSLLEITELRHGLTIQAFSHVGRVRLGGFQITILPKINQSSLLNLLRYAYGFRKLRLFSDAAQRIEQAGFEDLLVSQLNAEVEELLSRGLVRQYVSRNEYLASPRGRIDIQRIANDGGLVAATLPCIHHPRIEDTLLNRVLLSGLHLASIITHDMQLRRESRRLAAVFEDSVTGIRLNATVFEQLTNRMNRLTVAYQAAVSLIRLLWESQGVSFIGRNTSLRIPGFLFDMNRFFQSLLARFLADNLLGLKVKEEHRLVGMMKYTLGFNPRNRRSPSPRPDFVVLDGNKAVAMLDAKYRDLWELPLPRDMLYQLAIYAAVHNDKTATILFPTTDKQATESRIDIRDPVLRLGIAQVRLRPVLMSRIEELVLAKPTAATTRQRSEFARWLVFG